MSKKPVEYADLSPTGVDKVNELRAEFAQAQHDFYKRNGADATFFTEGPSMTRQEFADECDINSIMEKYDGYLSDPMRSMREPMYVDFTELPDTLMGTMELVKQASDAFYRLPAVVRKEFDNDPMMFGDFAADPANIDRLREWGLAKPKPAPEPAAAPAAAPSAGAPGAAPEPAKGSSTHGST